MAPWTDWVEHLCEMCHRMTCTSWNMQHSLHIFTISKRQMASLLSSNFPIDHECRNVWTAVLRCITCTQFQRWQFAKYVGNTTVIPIKMSQITNIVFSNCNQLSSMIGKDGWSDTWLQRSAHLNQFCIKLWPLKKGTEDFILKFQHEQVDVI